MNPLRVGVVRTAHWPVIGGVYRAIYRVQIENAARLISRIDGVNAVLLRGSTRRHIFPGLTDIDLVVILASGLALENEVRVVESIGAAVRRVNWWAPLIRDIHLVAKEELRALDRLGGAFVHMLRQDTTALFGQVDIPAPAHEISRVLQREAILRETLFWTGRAFQQLMNEPKYVGQRLAARSLVKADVFIAALRSEDLDLQACLARCQNLLEPSTAGWVDALQRLREAEQFLTDAPQVIVRADRNERMPAWTRMAPRLSQWAAPLAKHPAVAAVVLSAEGASEHDIRLYVALDPYHADAEAALGDLRRLVRGGDVMDPGYYSRAPLPLVVTPALLQRPGFLRSTASEPWARALFGKTLLGKETAARGSHEEALRGVTYSLASAVVRARELWRQPMSQRVAARWTDIVNGVIPTAQTLVETGEIRVTANQNSFSDAVLTARSLRNRQRRMEVYGAIRDGIRLWLPKLLDLVAASTDSAAG